MIEQDKKQAQAKVSMEGQGLGHVPALRPKVAQQSGGIDEEVFVFLPPQGMGTSICAFPKRTGFLFGRLSTESKKRNSKILGLSQNSKGGGG